jgi:hypothetical protein
MSYQRYVMYSSSCERCLKIMKERNGRDHRLITNEALSFEDITKEDNLLRLKRSEQEQKNSHRLKKEQLLIWRTKVYEYLKLHRMSKTETHSKACIERKCYGCSYFGFEGHSSWCTGKSNGCYYCEQKPGRYLDTQYSYHSESWPTFCNACPASIYDFSKNEFCDYFNNRITISYFKYYTKECQGCQILKEKRNGTEIIEEIISK